MADIFISYARPDRDRIEKLASALEAEGYSVWWDRRMVGGAEFAAEIERELEAAQIVIAAWSKEGVKSTWVKDEAVVAREAGKLIPLSLDGTQSPLGFKQFHLIDIGSWNGAPDASALNELSRTIKARLTGEAPPAPTAPEKSFFSTVAQMARGAHVGVIITFIVAVAIVSIVAIGSFDEGDNASAERLTSAEGRESAQMDWNWQSGSAPAEAGPSEPISTDPASIAVLPFADLSPEGNQEYFSDGMAEEILNVLAHVDGLKVASRTSSFQFKRRDIGAPQIAGQLGVRHVLEGSVRKAGDTLRITAQLIDAETDAHLWSETFDRPLSAENIFAIQDEIASAIVEALHGVMDLAAPEVVVEATTTNLSAYELYLEALANFQARSNLDVADELLAQATALDTGFVKAWSLRAALQQVMQDYGYGDGVSVDELMQRTEEFAGQALALDSNNALALASISGMRLRIAELTIGEENIGELIRDLERSISIAPNDSSVVNWLGLAYSMVGEREKALEIYRNCAEIDPFFAPCSDNIYDTLATLGRYDEAWRHFQAALARGVTSSNWVNFSVLAHFDERTMFVFTANQTRWLPGWRRHDELYEAFKAHGEGHEELVEELRDYASGVGIIPGQYLSTLLIPMGIYDMLPFPLYMWGEDFAKYRQSPQFKDYVHKTGIYDYWLAEGFPPQCRPLADNDFECD